MITKNMLILNAVLFLVAMSDIIKGAAVFNDSPGVQVVTAGQQCIFEWTLTSQFDTTLVGTYFEIHADQFVFGSHILRYTSAAGGGTCDKIMDTRLSCITNGAIVGFRMNNPGDADARKYVISVRVDAFVSSEQNDDATLYLAKPPSTPMITGNTDLSLEDTTELSCASVAQSLPADLRPDIVYTWTSTMSSGNFVPNQDKVAVGPVERADNGDTITCRVNEQNMEPFVERQVTLNVIYAPGTPELTAIKTTVVEGNDDLRLTCNLHGGQEGNPSTYTYHWQVDTPFSPSHTVRILVIDKAGLSATEHQGTWTCRAVNSVGQGPTDSLGIAVNARPSIQQNLSNKNITINDTLSVECSFRAKPSATIAWTYNGTSTLNQEALTISTSTEADGVYTITKSTLRWKTGASLDAKSTVGGRYVCTADNGILGPVSSGTMLLNVLYPPGKVILGEIRPYYIQGEDALRLTCSYSTYRGNPPAERLVWEKVGSSGAPTETTDGVVQIPAADVSVAKHDGQWRCWAQTATGQNPGEKAAVAVVVYARPHITHFTASSKNLTEGDSFSLTCGVTSSPPSEISFIHMREGQTEIITPTRQDNNSAVYTKLSVGCRDAGMYRCQADNKVIETTQSEDTHPLVVKCAPTAEYIWPPARNVMVVSGESVAFVVSLLSYPLAEEHITWHLSGSDTLATGTTVSLYGPVTTLSIGNVTMSHYGNYTLTVDNEIGRPLILWFSLSQKPTTPEKSGLSAGIVTGFAILAVLVLALIIALVVVIIRSRNMSDKNKGHQTVTESVSYMNVGVETSTKRSGSKIEDSVSSRVELKHPVDITTGTYDELGETIQYQGPYEELHVK